MLRGLQPRIGIIACALLTALFLSYGCGKGSGSGVKGLSGGGDVLVSMGSEVITAGEYKEELAILPPDYRDAANIYKVQFLEGLINKHLLLREAERRNLQNAEAVKNILSKAKDEIMIRELIDREVNSRAQVAESEVEDRYKENQNSYIEPARINASHILVDSEVIAAKILSDLEHGVDFAKLAGEYSLDMPTKSAGGNIGYYAKGTLLPEFEQACEGLEVGETSGVVKTDIGYHVIRIIDRKEAAPKSLEEVRGEIKAELTMEKQTALYDKLLQGLRKKEKVSINAELLEAIDLSDVPASP